MIISCGDNDSSTTIQPTTALKGAVLVNGLASAVVCLDSNNDAKCQHDEQHTSVQNGLFNLKADANAAAITSLTAEVILKNGNRIALQAAPQSSVINALSSAAVAYQDFNSGSNKSEANDYLTRMCETAYPINEAASYADDINYDNPDDLLEKTGPKVCSHIVQSLVESAFIKTSVLDENSISNSDKLAAINHKILLNPNEVLREIHKFRRNPTIDISVDNMSLLTQQLLSLSPQEVLNTKPFIQAIQQAKLATMTDMSMMSLDGLTTFFTRVHENDPQPEYINRTLDITSASANIEKMKWNGSEFMLNTETRKGEYYVPVDNEWLERNGEIVLTMPQSNTEFNAKIAGFDALDVSMTGSIINISNLSMKQVLSMQSSMYPKAAPIMNDWVDMLADSETFGPLSKAIQVTMVNQNDSMLMPINTKAPCPQFNNVCNLVNTKSSIEGEVVKATSVNDILLNSPLVIVEKNGQQELLARFEPEGEVVFYVNDYQASSGSNEQTIPMVDRKLQLLAKGQWQHQQYQGATVINFDIPSKLSIENQPLMLDKALTFLEFKGTVRVAQRINKGTVLRRNLMILNQPATVDILKAIQTQNINTTGMPGLNTMLPSCLQHDSIYQRLANSRVLSKKAEHLFMAAKKNCLDLNIESFNLPDLLSAHNLVEHDINKKPILEISVNDEAATITRSPALTDPQVTSVNYQDNVLEVFMADSENNRTFSIRLAAMRQDGDVISFKVFTQQSENDFETHQGTIESRMMMLVKKPTPLP